MNRIASLATAAGATALALIAVGGFALSSGGDTGDAADGAPRASNLLGDGALAVADPAGMGAATNGDVTERGGTETREAHDRREREDDDDDDHDDDHRGRGGDDDDD